MNSASANNYFSDQANLLLSILAKQPHGDHPSLDGPVGHMRHWLQVRQHPMAQCSDRELGAIMLTAKTKLHDRQTAPLTGHA